VTSTTKADITRQAITKRVRALNEALALIEETYRAARRGERHGTISRAYAAYVAATQAEWDAYEADMIPFRASLAAANS
jgi:predicted transcriptional regulator